MQIHGPSGTMAVQYSKKNWVSDSRPAKKIMSTLPSSTRREFNSKLRVRGRARSPREPFRARMHVHMCVLVCAGPIEAVGPRLSCDSRYFVCYLLEVLLEVYNL